MLYPNKLVCLTAAHPMSGLQSCQRQTVTNTLDYYDTELITAVKGSSVQALQGPIL